MTAHSQVDISSDLIAFIRDSFLDGDPEGELGLDTPLLELGILNSLNTALLIAHLGEAFGLEFPVNDVTADTFRSVRSLTDVVQATLARG